MRVPFDQIAKEYDGSFTHSKVGRLQRKMVWAYIEKIIPQLPGIEILELNCGTGEDAIIFGEKGFHIVATDVSGNMLKVAEEKVARFSMQQHVHVRQFDLEGFDVTLFDKKFDLIFSNFGGLNCLSPLSLKKLLNKIPSILNPGGRFIAVIMPKNCLWESFYFLGKLQFKKAFRRWTNGSVLANLKTTPIATWYYNPSSIKNWMGTNCVRINCRPIGLALPPSYLENYFATRGKTLMRLNSIEAILNQFSSLSLFADHFMIDIRLL